MSMGTILLGEQGALEPTASVKALQMESFLMTIDMCTDFIPSKPFR